MIMATIGTCIFWITTIFSSTMCMKKFDNIRTIDGPEEFEKALNEKFIILNGQFLSLNDLYDDNRPTFTNFEPGKSIIEALFTKKIYISDEILEIFTFSCPGGKYVDRTFTLLQRSPDHQTTNVDIDTSTTIARIIQKRVKTKGLRYISPIVIQGHSGMGKTTALAKIEYEVSALLKTSWVISVDWDIMVDSLSPDEMSYDNIFKKLNIREEVRDLFNHLLKINPSKFVLLIDNVQNVINEKVSKTMVIINDLAEKGVSVVMTARPEFLNYWYNYYTKQLKRTDKYIIYDIPAMSKTETKIFLRNIWQTALASAQLTFMSDAESRAVDEYSRTFTKILYNTRISKTPRVLKNLADTFTRLSLPRWHSTKLYPVGCLDYVLDREIERRNLYDTIKHASFNLYNFYDAHLIPHNWLNDMPTYYSIQALANVIQREESSQTNPYSLNVKLVMTKELGTPELIVKSNCLSPLTKYNNRVPLAFVDMEVERFLAAKYIVVVMNDLNKFSDDPTWITLLRMIFTEERYSNLLEFINDNTESINLYVVHYIVTSDNDVFDVIISNILKHGFEDLYLMIHQSLIEYGGENCLAEYFKTMKSEDPRERSLGMISAKTMKQERRSQVRLVVMHDMTRTLKMLITRKIKLKLPRYFVLILGKIVRRKPINVDLFMLALEHFRQMPQSHVKHQRVTVSKLNELMFAAMTNIGDGCQPVVNYLIILGANPYTFDKKINSILHYTLKWNNRELLNYVLHHLDGWNLNQMRKISNVLYNIAFDANPSPIITMDGWWEMMEYLLMNVPHDYSQDPAIVRVYLKTFNPPDDVDARKLFQSLYNLPEIDNISEFDVRKISINTIIPSSEANKLSSEINLNPFKLKILPEKILSLRRMLLLHQLYEQTSSRISMTEILVHYKGIDDMSVVDRNSYRNSIVAISHREKNILTVADRTRIFFHLLDNMKCLNDAEDLNYFVDKNVFSTHFNVYENRIGLIVDDQQQKSLKILVDIYATKLSYTADRIGPVNRYAVRDSSSKRNRGDSQKMVMMDYQEAGPSTRGYRFPGDPLQCLSPKRARLFIRSTDCLYSWKDVNDFNDAVGNRQSVDAIRVNSDNFMCTLAAMEYSNPVKALQLVQLVKQLTIRSDVNILTRNSRMIAQNVLQYGSLSAYQQHQRSVHLIHDFWPGPQAKQSVFSTHRSIVLYAAASISIVRAIHGVISVCLQAHDNNCIHATSMLAISASMIPANYLALKYTPWLTERGASVALDLLPRAAPSFMRENLKLLRLHSVKYSSVTTGAVVMGVGLGLDLYTIIQMSNMIAACSKDSGNCPTNVKIDYIISLTFSCVSIAVMGGIFLSGVGFAASVLIGIGLLVMEIVAMSVNEVHYYNTKYRTTWDENLLIFFHKIVLQPPPTDVQALVNRTDQINFLQDRIQHFLECSNENIVAYGTGIGTYSNSQIIASKGIINMADENLNNSHGLSRVLPNNDTSICSPKQDRSEIYEKFENNQNNSLYRCHNAFVIVHKERWNRRSDKSLIIYDLEFIESGRIVGSDVLNNLFLISNGTQTLDIISGNGKNCSNNFIVRGDSFRGNILLRKSYRSILDLTNVNSPIVHFNWTDISETGRVQFGSIVTDAFYIMSIASSNLHIIGRPSRSDQFSCNYGKYHDRHENALRISVDGGGGESYAAMDEINNCQVSVVHPFTRIIGSDRSKNSSYMTHISLAHKSMEISTISYSTIQSRQSYFSIIFGKFPIFTSLYEIYFNPMNNTLFWEIAASNATRLILSIEPYKLNLAIPDNAAQLSNSSITCLFTDSYYNTIVIPVINRSTNTTRVTIKDFNVFGTINNSRLVDVYDKYLYITNFIEDDEFHVATKLTHQSNGQTFSFGSNANDRFYIDVNTSFVFGGNGNDIYVLSKQSPSYIWIENEAQDSALDTLLIPNTTCVSLSAERGSPNTDCCNGSSYDVTLICSMNATTKINVVLRNYLLDKFCRHLQIYFGDEIYALIPDAWTRDVEHVKTIDLALMFSFGGSHTVILTLTSRDHYLVLNGTDESNPIVAYKYKSNDVILTLKYLSDYSSSFVILQDFLVNGTYNISTNWLALKIFVISDAVTENITRTLNATDIQNLLVTLKDHDNGRSDGVHDGVGSNFIKEYHVNISDANRNKMIVIQHNDGSTSDRVGVLMVFGASPGEFTADFDRNNTSLLLCALETCVCIKNWCSARHRLNRVEFIQSLDRQSLVISQLDQYDCPQGAQSNDREQLVKLMNERFVTGQKRLELMIENNENDNFRLMRCLGSLLADVLTQKLMYRMFDFSSVIEQTHYIQDNEALFVRENIEKLNLVSFRQYFTSTLKRFVINGATRDELPVIFTLCNDIDLIDDICWRNLISSFENFNTESQSRPKFQILYESVLHLSNCTKVM